MREEALFHFDYILMRLLGISDESKTRQMERSDSKPQIKFIYMFMYKA